jgi:hypothetical protein
MGAEATALREEVTRFVWTSSVSDWAMNATQNPDTAILRWTESPKLVSWEVPEKKEAGNPMSGTRLVYYLTKLRCH